MAESSIQIDVDLSEIKGLSKTMLGKADQAMNYLTQDLLAESVKEAPVDKGVLQTRFDMRKVEELVYTIWNNVHYRWFVHEGTGIYGPHSRPITPVSSKFLVFQVSGKTVFAKSIKGQKPNKYYDRAINTVKGKVGMYIKKAVG